MPGACVQYNDFSGKAVHDAGGVPRPTTKETCGLRRRQFRGEPDLSLKGFAPSGGSAPHIAVLLLFWLTTAAAAAAAALVHPWLAAAPAVLAAAVALTGVPGPFALRALGALVLLSAGLAPIAPGAALAGAGIVAVVALLTPVHERHGATMADLQRHVERARRRGEPTWVLAADVAGDAVPSSEPLLELFRVTDGVLVEHSNEGFRLLAVLHGEDFSRAGLERRIGIELGDDARLGWAELGPDGLSLDVLAGHARASLTDAPQAAAAPRVELASLGSVA
jgi:hypothetical protein